MSCSKALMTDLYQLTMAAAYYDSQKDATATFELFVREMPLTRTHLVFAGLAQALEYLKDLRFQADEIEYLRMLPVFESVSEGFFDFLREFRFAGQVWAMEEGEIFFAGEPVMRIKAPIIQAQIVETYLLSEINFQTMIASKASRVVEAAQGRPVADFGTRRAHGPEAGIFAARACYIGGCNGTSNVYAGKAFGIPVVGTAAHSFVMAFDNEEEAFTAYASVFPEHSILLIDTYDVLEGARRASFHEKIQGVRLDSGDLAELSIKVRNILDSEGLKDAKIVASGDLDEVRISELLKDGAQIDSFGVGTKMVTSMDAPALGGIYKLVELEEGGQIKPKAKFSEDKATYPGAKQVYRNYENGAAVQDIVSHHEEEPRAKGTPLLHEVMKNGEILVLIPSVDEIRNQYLENREMFAPEVIDMDANKPYPVVYSKQILEMAQKEKNRTM